MNLHEKYKKESGFDVGAINTIGTTYYSGDYVEWLEGKINSPVIVALKGKKKRCYTTWKKHTGITTIHKQKYKDTTGKILKASEVTKMYQAYLNLN